MCEKCLSTSHHEDLKEHQAKTFQSLVLRGRLQTVVICITEIQKEKLMHAKDACTNKVQHVLDMFRKKYPEAHSLSDRSLDTYPGRPP